MLNIQNITALRMERQYLSKKAGSEEYDELYRDVSPVQNVYWCGFGDPPIITFRAGFNDLEYNRKRQFERKLVKGRFQGGNVGFVDVDDFELFAGLFRKTPAYDDKQELLLSLIEREGPMNIGLMKEMTGLLVKEITPALHKLQEAFIIFEDQFDGEWDRGWYRLEEMFPGLNVSKYTQHEALKAVLQRFAYRHVHFTVKMAKSFYRLPEKEITAVAKELENEGVFTIFENGYLLKKDYDLLVDKEFGKNRSVFVLHRNDFLVKSHEHMLKDRFSHETWDVLQYILIDGRFNGAVLGKFKNGPYILEDVCLDIPEKEKVERKDEIIEAVYTVNNRLKSPLQRYCGGEA